MSDEPKRTWWNWRRREVPSIAPPHADLPPISRADLKSLFDSLSRPNPAPCTHTFKGTIAFLRGQGLPIEETVRWLQGNGAGCDCEVIFNTDAEWGEWSGRSPLEEDEL